MRRPTPKKRHATLADIAASTGVTPMTVSRVVNGNGYVSAETREKVLHAVSALNYRRNGLARGLKRQRTDTIGLVLGDIANPFAAELARAVREVMTAKGYNVFICVSEHSAREDIAAFESLADHRVDGVIVATRANKLGNDRLAEMIEGGIPIVLIGRDFHHPNADLIAADNLRGGYDATAHLIALGHKNIGFIGVTPTSGVGLRRYHGYLEAMREHGLKVDERLIVGRADDGDQWPGYSTETMGYEGMKKLLSLRKRPTAVFARNDFTALGAMSAIKEAGLKIPQEIAVVGYDDVPMATHTTPPLTTVRQPTREQGRIAAEALLRRMESAETPAREERVMKCELVVRASTVAD
ncbi:MAG: LacI family transcriptional regulator [Acidobacteriota bacterium]|jgi:DNA-binding LacI/PurR family transcriptional regulator|nr:LacI family transcriptional regulator [Acidobacteriota bacterium]